MAGEVKSGYIDRIEVQNFKSYRGKHVIGPFRDFTAVIGPNGSGMSCFLVQCDRCVRFNFLTHFSLIGKSNVMDAISFVLGLDSKKLRSAKLEDLVNEEAKNVRKPVLAFVSMFFVDIDGQEHVFTRSLRSKNDDPESSNYEEAFRYNNEVGKKGYINALKTIGVSVDVPNCLVFQVRCYLYSCYIILLFHLKHSRYLFSFL